MCLRTIRRCSKCGEFEHYVKIFNDVGELVAFRCQRCGYEGKRREDECAEQMFFVETF